MQLREIGLVWDAIEPSITDRPDLVAFNPGLGALQDSARNATEPRSFVLERIGMIRREPELPISWFQLGRQGVLGVRPEPLLGVIGTRGLRLELTPPESQPIEMWVYDLREYRTVPIGSLLVPLDLIARPP